MKRLLLSGALFLAGWLFVASAQGTVSVDPSITGTIPEDYYVQSTAFGPHTTAFNAHESTFNAYTSEDRITDTTFSAYTSSADGGTDYIFLRDEKAQNTHGGTFTLGDWRTRDINTEVSDVGGFANISSNNQFILQPGAYRFSSSAPHHFIGGNQLRLYNITDAEVTEIGTSEYNPNVQSLTVRAFIAGSFTIGAAKAFELQHHGTTTRNVDGFGFAANHATEVYSMLEFWREK